MDRKLPSAKTQRNLGFIVFLSFFFYFISKFYYSQSLYVLLICAKSLLVSLFYLKNITPIKTTTDINVILLSYLSLFLPFFYSSSSTISVLASNLSFFLIALFLIGHLISLLAIINLGTSFSIAPMKYKIVREGVYRYFKHPMYMGYIIAETSYVLLEFSFRNLFILLCGISLYCYRAKKENEILSS